MIDMTYSEIYVLITCGIFLICIGAYMMNDARKDLKKLNNKHVDKRHFSNRKDHAWYSVKSPELISFL